MMSHPLSSKAGFICEYLNNIGLQFSLTTHEAAETLDYYIYRVGLLQANNFSYATAVGLFRSVVSLIFIIITNYVSGKIDEDGGIW